MQRKIRNEKLHNLFLSPNCISTIKPRRMCERNEKCIKTCNCITLRSEDMIVSQVVQDMIQWQTVVNVIMNLCVKFKAGNFLTN